MKKITVILVALLLICSMSTLSFAQTSPVKTAKKAKVSTEIIRGKIVSIDSAKNEIVIKDNKTGLEKSILVNAKEVGSLKVGEELKVTLKSGTNIAESVKKIVHKIKSTKK